MRTTMISPTLLGAVTLLCAPLCSATPTLTAELDYGTFEGAYNSKYNISYWQKIPFAAPPVGQNRFRAPQPPLKIANGTYNSTSTFDYCPQRTVNGTEDCLYLGLFSRPWSTGQALRPVVVNFFGGAYIEGGGSFSIPPSTYPTLNVSSQNDWIMVEPNYRVNAFGFLPGKEIALDPNSDLNVGLLDQHYVLQWVNKYITQFGGDPNNVAIWGQSAGAGSVVAQVIAQNGDEHPRLFNRALASSPFWAKTYNYAAPEAQWIYDTFANMTGCSGPNSLQCLKAADLQVLRTAALAISGSHTYNTSSYTWAPVIDGTFLTEPLSAAISRRAVNIDYGFGVYNLHEGENFVPPGLKNASDTGSPPFNSSLASFQSWLRGYLPGLNNWQLDVVQQLYPPSGSAENLPSYNTSFVRAGLIFRDTVLACPALWMAGSAPKASYLAEYTILPATHGSDTYWWNQVNVAQTTDPTTYHGYTGAFASFFQIANPNTLKLTNESQAEVPLLQPQSRWSRTQQEFVIATDNFTDVAIPQLEVRCAFWKAVAPQIPI